MAANTESPQTVGLVVIGNEILTGKTEDSNAPFLCKELNFLGLDLQRIVTIPDDFEVIGHSVREFSDQFTWVFTSGGIGPTHDDITIPAIAAGFGVETVQEPSLAQGIRTHYGERMTEDHLLMARVPEGAELVEIPGRFFWQVRFRNIFIMPGVPQLFRHRFEALKSMLQGSPVSLKEFFLNADEGVIAAALREVDEKYPDVLIGSYPDFFRRDFSVKVTVEARNADLLEQAQAELRGLLQGLPIEIVRES